MGSTLRPPDLFETTIALDEIKVPLALAKGRYEHLSDDQLADHMDDLYAELERRTELEGAHDGS